MVEHVAEDDFERKLGVKERSGFEEALEFCEAAAGLLGAGDVLHACEEVRKGFVGGAGGRTENDFVGILEAEADNVAVLELAAFHFFAVDEKAAALAAVLDVEAIAFDDDGGAIARDAAVGKLEMVAGFGAAADHKRSLRDAGVPPLAVWRDNFKDRFATWRNGVRHE